MSARQSPSTLPTSGARSSLAVLAAATPADRDRFVDLLRAASILVVVLGHWLMAAVVRDDGVLRADNALAHATWLQPLTWLLQVMPVFFMVAGFANARALRRADGTSSRLFADRTRRLVGPTLVFATCWLVAANVLVAADVAGPTVHDVARTAAQPLWFLAVYLLLVAVAPMQMRAHRSHPFVLVAVLVVIAALLDTCRLTGFVPALATGNYLAVFMVAQELGFWYADGRLLRIGAPALWAGLGVTAGGLTALTTLGPYPVSMVGVPGEELSNMSPPTICLLLVTVAQVSLLLLLRPAIVRWLHRPRVWRATVLANSAVLTVFLWHLTAFVSGAAILTGLRLSLAEPGSAGWWAAKPLWIATALALLVGLAVLLSPLERRTVRGGAAPSARTGLVAVLFVAAGFAGLATSAFAHPFTVSGSALLGMRFMPAVAFGLLVAGAALSVLPGGHAPSKPGPPFGH